MSKFLDDFVALCETNNKPIIRVSESDAEGNIETINLRPACDCLNCYSVAKCFTMTAIGILEDEGLLSTEERIVDIFTEYITEKTDPRWKDVTIDMVLRHYAGFSRGFMDIDQLDMKENFGRDLLACLFSTPLDLDPGTEFRYSDAAYYLASRVVSKKCGRKMDDYLWDKLFWPLDFQEMAWSTCPMGYPMGATGLYIKSKDMVKLGVLYMNKGIYKGQRLLSEAWVEKAKNRQYDFYPTGYGNSFMKSGMHGQKLIIIPETGRCVAWHACGGGGESSVDEVAWSYNYRD